MIGEITEQVKENLITAKESEQQQLTLYHAEVDKEWGAYYQDLSNMIEDLHVFEPGDLVTYNECKLNGLNIVDPPQCWLTNEYPDALCS